ncbi:MAG: leucine-rich repeat domain-containing protein [Clostridia bacterium]|nr:leucine-rich repeat domain-containing protein [Clostridia bacterium]
MNDIRSFEPMFGEWYAEQMLGAGSFGRVYRAYRWENGVKELSAIKHMSVPFDEGEIFSLRGEGMDDMSISSYYKDLVNSIIDEARIMSALRDCPYIVGYEDSCIMTKSTGIGYDVFIRMELLQSLTSRLVNGVLPYDEVLKLGIDICSALDVCSQRGIIHRDIKPDNIFVNDRGVYKLGDFGIARNLEKTATFMSKKGTFNYMAPEVYKGEKYGASCDLYSLGLVLYRLLNRGRLPFLPLNVDVPSALMREDAVRRRLSGEALPAPCDADPVFTSIIFRACAYDPKARYRSAAEMKSFLENLSEHKDEILKMAAANPQARPVQQVLYTAPAPDPDATQSVQAPSAYAPAAPVQQAPAAPVYTAPAQQEAAPAEKEETGRKRSPVIAILAAVLGVALIGLGILVLPGLLNKDTGKTADSQDTSTQAVTAAPANTPDGIVTPAPADPTDAPEDTEYSFGDGDFEAAYRAEYSKTGTVKTSELLEVSRLEFDSKELTDISDIAAFKNVKRVFLRWNKITDISAMSGLTQIDRLFLSENSITDIGALKGMTKLERLDLGLNQIEDIDALRYLAQLDTLGLSGNAVRDISPLKGLERLETLYIDHNKITSISDLKGLVRMKELRISGNELDSIAAVANMTELTSLWASKCGFSDISPLRGLTKLQVLDLEGNSIKDISALAGLTALKELNLSGNRIDSITALKGLTNLETLTLSGNPLTEAQLSELRSALPGCDVVY